MRSALTRGLAVLAAVTFTARAGADVWLEVGDAGQLPGTAQFVVGGLTPAPLDSISGALSSANDVDLYLITISNPAAFSATTVGQPGTLVDTQLFLFTAAGLGVEANDDVSLANVRSTLPAGDPNAPTVPGLYLLAISSFNNDPLAPGGERIFPDSSLGVLGPTGPGGGQPLSGWTNDGQGAGTYQIALTGTEIAVIPEPATVMLLSAGVVGLVGCGWRRRKRAA